VKLSIDTTANTIVCEDNGHESKAPLYSAEAFAQLSRLWVKVGWDLKYPYGFTWMGRPIIQLPEDMIRIQETIYRTRPDVVVETGVAHGGSLIFYASLLKAMGRGRVVGVDVEIRPKNRAAIESHELHGLITLIEGSSVEPSIVAKVRAGIQPGERVLVILDSNHSKDHVTKELNAYSPLVSVDSYIVATDGIMQDLDDVPRGRSTWKEDNPQAAAKDFAQTHSDFVLETPPFIFSETSTSQQVTHWPGAYLRRVR
jgi:cephalosporin hydroxylase